MKKSLFVLVDKDNNFVYGGGSSTPKFLRSYDNIDSAKRALRYFGKAYRVVEYWYGTETD